VKYNRTRSFVAVVALIGAFPLSARADFVVKGASNPTSTAAPVAMAPIVDPGDRAQAAGRAAGRTAPATHWKMAYGFGEQVPLDFACRQIVPRAVRVTYGPGARPDMVVSWKGGKPWNRTLAEAVAPLGLRLVINRTVVEIRN